MTTPQPLKPYQEEFIQFLVACEVLTFGDFTTKSGRKTPYFVNTGRFDSGSQIAQLGKFYAQHIVDNRLTDCSSIFGPAYKGVPLCVTTSIALAEAHNQDIGFTFNRKEAKEHGDKGTFVGKKLEEGSRVVIVEDVVTAGTTLKEIVPVLRDTAKTEVGGVVISVDRCERGSGSGTAIQEVQELLDIQVYPLVSIYQIRNYLSQENPSGLVLSDELQTRIEAYLKEYGAA